MEDKKPQSLADYAQHAFNNLTPLEQKVLRRMSIGKEVKSAKMVIEVPKSRIKWPK